MIKHLKPRSKKEIEALEKYKILYLQDALPRQQEDGGWWIFWTPEGLSQIITALEKKYPTYEYCDTITNGNGMFHEFVVLKRKS